MSTETAVQTASDDTIWAELLDGEEYVSGWGVILKGADVTAAQVEEAMAYHHGTGWARIVTQVQHLTYQRRVMWCSRHGSGFGCDHEGEWHSHWHEVKHNPAAGDCCYTVAIPVWPTAEVSR